MIDDGLRARLEEARAQLRQHLTEGIVPFWLDRAIDKECGGYHADFDGEGRPIPGPGDKYIVAQARLLWAFSRFARSGVGDTARLEEAARHGFAFFAGHFHDERRGGWHWRVDRAGHVLDGAKLMYGQSFALYAVSEYAIATGDPAARAIAEVTFDDLVARALDGRYGGYRENFDADWLPAAGGSAAGDRKSLDIHLHLLEAFTRLTQLTEGELHARRLAEVRDVILGHMIDGESGAGGTQYDLAFRPLPPIVIDRTWVAERPAERPAGATDAGASGTDSIGAGTSHAEPARVVGETSYAHNLELGWLLALADDVLGQPGAHNAEIVRFGEHALRWGTDPDYGGVYRDGPFFGPASDTDKEFWQNAEAMPGFLQTYASSGDPRFLEAFLGVWGFVRRHLINPTVGEWHTRTTAAGGLLVADIGGPWKVCYHSGRATLEAIGRLDAILA